MPDLNPDVIGGSAKDRFFAGVVQDECPARGSPVPDQYPVRSSLVPDIESTLPALLNSKLATEIDSAARFIAEALA